MDIELGGNVRERNVSMESSEVHKCPLCGNRFAESDVKCSGCLLSKNCNLLCCPNCGYSYKERSALVDFLKKRRGKRDGK